MEYESGKLIVWPSSCKWQKEPLLDASSYRAVDWPLGASPNPVHEHLCFFADARLLGER
jgi:hypothetical protein